MLNTAIPVLDDDTFTGSVIGYAQSEEEALFVYRKSTSHLDLDIEPNSMRYRTQGVSYDPDCNTREDAEAVDKYGAWAPVF